MSTESRSAGEQLDPGPPAALVCPRCKGRNPAGAAWCGQCFNPLVTSSASTGAPPARAARNALVPTGSGPAGPDAGKAGVRATAEGVLWTCALCGGDNSLDAFTCSVCEAPLSASVRPSGPVRPQRDPGKAALISLLMPGAGHAYLGLWGQAVARGILSTWAVCVFVVAAFGAGVTQRLVAAVFAVAAAGLWAVSAHDAYRAAQGADDAALLKGRAFLWLVVGLLLALVVALVLSALGAARP